MGLLKNILGKKEDTIKSYEDFWNWFQNNEKSFYNVLKNNGNIEKDFFNKLSPKLNELREGYWFLAGMFDSNTAELVVTADGIIKNIVFVEELISTAPKLNGWIFTALKPEQDIKDVNIRMDDLKFNKDNLFFYSNDNAKFPDEIDITIVHADYEENLKKPIISGTYIFIDNYLGELNSVNTIDNLKIISKEQAEKELIPIEKLKDFLKWRQKEFIEKYEATRYGTENDNYSSLEATLNNGKPLIAIVNSALLSWDKKASHPWIAFMEIKYPGNENGMPDNLTYALLNEIEDEIMSYLKDLDGYLNIGRQTADSSRVIYFACKDYRIPSKVFSQIQKKYYKKYSIDFDIYKDKYWKSFDRFIPKIE